MLWSRFLRNKELKENANGNKKTDNPNQEQIETSCSMIAKCPRCGCPIEGLTLVCPRCRELIPRGCSGNCSSCSHHDA